MRRASAGEDSGRDVLTSCKAASEMGSTAMSDSTRFEEFILAQAVALRANDQPPRAKAEWERRRPLLRQEILAAAGIFPADPCDLKPEIRGKIDHDDYRIENLIFQSRPDVWVTANLYVPKKVKGKSPAVLCVHGHWSGARRDPVVAVALPRARSVRLCRSSDRCLWRRRTIRFARLGHLPRRTVRGDAVAARLHAARHAGLRQSSRCRLFAHPGRSGWHEDRHHRGVRRRKPDHVRRRARRTPRCGRSGLLGRHLSGLSQSRLLRLRSAARRLAVHRGRRRARPGRSACAACHQRQPRCLPVQSRRGAKEHRPGPRDL